jgi:histidine triad (HIT) family protein
MLSEEQTKQIKEKIIEQIDSNLPEEKRAEAKTQVESMDSESLENFLNQNQQMQTQSASGQEGQQCVFCLINSKQIPSHILEENKNMTAILEINPISKGHTIIIPKEHLGENKIGEEASSLAKVISKKIKRELKPKEVIFSENRLFNHGILNVIPIYENETANSVRYKAEESELEEMQKLLTKEVIEKKEKIEKIKKLKIERIVKKPKKLKRVKRVKKLVDKKWVPNRIP